MIRVVAAAIAPIALSLAIPAHAQTAPQDQAMHHATPDAPMLAFSITEEVKSAPDRASIGAGVTTTAATAVEAMRQNAAAMTRVIRALRGARVPERDIQTSGVTLQPQYDYSGQQNGQPPRFNGYQVTNQVRVTTADISGVGRLLDTLVEAGGTNLDGPSFFVADPDPTLDTARTTALRRAGERAAFYARAAGYRTARLVSVSEGQAFDGPRPMMRMQVQDIAASGTPVQPGQVSNSVTLNLQYRMER